MRTKSQRVVTNFGRFARGAQHLCFSLAVAPAALGCGSGGNSSGSVDSGPGSALDAMTAAGNTDATTKGRDGASADGDGAPATGNDGAAATDESGTGAEDASGDAEEAADGGGDAGRCGAGDPKLPAEPTFPQACTTLSAGQNVDGGVPGESQLDTMRIQSALDACPSGQAVKLTNSGVSGAFVTGPLTLPSGVALWIDSDTTLYASRNAGLYGSSCAQSSGTCKALITVSGSGSGIFGDGVIDGQGGEQIVGKSQSWWDLSDALASSNGSAANPSLVEVSGAKNFTMYRITLHDSPKFHVKLDAAGFVVWGVTIKTPSKAANAQGTKLTAVNARNTDGIDPGEAASNGYIVCSDISDGDDQIAIKGGTGVSNLTIAHNHFGAGHGMSIGSETNGGVSQIDVYDLSIDGTNSGMGGGSSNGIRIKSDSSRGGLVTGVTYTDVCVREIANPIFITPKYSSSTGSLIPDYKDIVVRDFRSVASSVTPAVTLDGYDSSHMLGITLDNVTVDGIKASNVTASYANVTLGPGAVNFTPSGSHVAVDGGASGSSTPNGCAGKWVAF